MSILNLKGKVYHRLTVLEKAPNIKNKTAWKCLCECGTIKIIKTENLRDGSTKSCGCLNIEKSKEKKPYLACIKYHPQITSARRVWKDRYNDGIDFEDFYRISQQNCFYCGVKPGNVQNTAKSDIKSSLYAKENGDFKYNGLDRVDSKLPHLITNVVPCCKWCNFSKRERDFAEFKNWIFELYQNIVKIPDVNYIHNYIAQNIKQEKSTMPYINQDSFKCLLGPQAKEVVISNNLFLWKVGKKKHFAVEGTLNDQNIQELKTYGESNFHYISPDNFEILKNNFKADKVKHMSVIIDIQDLSFKGDKYKSIRHCLNRCKKEEFIIESNYRQLQDVKNLIEEWSNDYTEKYFRDNSGKNMHFYKNNYHLGLDSVFVYKGDSLVAFGTLSRNQGGYCSYILGKALYKRHYGLSEFADIELYKLAQGKGISFVNMGDATKGLIDYKTKFAHLTETHYDGSIL